MRLSIPTPSLVVLIGISGSGKSSFARKHFRATEVLSSDTCRGWVADDENDQSATQDAFAVLHFVAGIRLAAGRLTVVDATNVQPEARKSLLELARQHHLFAVALVLNLPERVCAERNRERPDRTFGPHVLRNQRSQLRQSLGRLEREGFRQVYVLNSAEEVDAAEVVRRPLWSDRRDEHGPFDVIGDIHGCFDELAELLEKLGYRVESASEGGRPAYHVTPPEGRRAVFLGDLVDRGPRSPDVLRLVMAMTRDGTALCVPGNHDDRLRRKLEGRDVRLAHGLAETLAQLEGESAEFLAEARRFLNGLVGHYVLDEGRLVVAHAGMKAEFQGRSSGAVRSFSLYGETTGETDEYGLPVRWNWAGEYRGRAMVVYGHTPVFEPEWLNGTINIDTGCVFGGRLTALRYPERTLVSVEARRAYAESARPLVPPPPLVTAQQLHDDLLYYEDVAGKRRIETRLHPPITVWEDNAAAALEVMSRFSADPRWLIYLPPTMSPPETTRREGLLEHPDEVFAYFRREGVRQVICEEKHMGSRVVVIACRDEDAARRRFGITGEFGICYTRTGRRFFDGPELERAVLDSVCAAMTCGDLWSELQTDWVCLDCELMPWSAKARTLLVEQYAPVGAAAGASLKAAAGVLARAAGRGLDVGALRADYATRQLQTERYLQAYRSYCWDVASAADLKLAPFHLLAVEGGVQAERDHCGHMEVLQRLCAAGDGLLVATRHRTVDLEDPGSEAEALEWWTTLTGSGGEGMVVKPREFVARGPRGLTQPAVKCRGPEYLRIIYGPEYDRPEHLERLRQRSVAAKRALAVREFALGIEALERFTRREPLRRVHECVFAVLALESEPVDPRL